MGFQKNLKKHLTNCAICAILNYRAENVPEGFCEICIYFPLSGFDFCIFLELQLTRRTAVETDLDSSVNALTISGCNSHAARRLKQHSPMLFVFQYHVATHTPHGG